jgi:hypothetical protein
MEINEIPAKEEKKSANLFLEVLVTGFLAVVFLVIIIKFLFF